MKSKTSASIKNCLAIAATSLIAGGAQATESTKDWDFATSVLGYSEQDRVSAVEFTVTADKVVEQTGKFSVKAVLDTLTGASANGAVAQRTAQTFTSPSGESQYSASAGETPLDSTFKDTRGQLSLSWLDALSEESTYTVGAYASIEHDYASVSINGQLSKDFNQKNTTLSIAASAGTNLIKPEGGIPVAFSSMAIDEGQFGSEEQFQNAYRATRNGGDDSINSGELLFGLTQVVNRQMLLQFNLGYAITSGYLTDPYKIFSVVNDQGVTQDYLYESRPDSRNKTSFFAMEKYHFDNSIFDLSYRYMKDDWGIQSHTIDTHWHIFADHDSFWEPHIRYYQQSMAEFYQPFLTEGQPLPDFVSADYRLSEMDGWTAGLKYGFRLSSGHRMEIRGEVYQQKVKDDGNDIPVELQNIDLHPDVTAVIFQINYYF